MKWYMPHHEEGLVQTGHASRQLATNGSVLTIMYPEIPNIICTRRAVSSFFLRLSRKAFPRNGRWVSL